MRWPWKRKAEEPAVMVSMECPHTWKDFPWVLKGIYDSKSNEIHIVITEPYVCIHCKKRIDATLLDCYKHAYNRERADEIVKAYRNEYDEYIRDAAIVEDMINDAIYVDREKLGIVEKLRGGRADNDMDLQADDG